MKKIFNIFYLLSALMLFSCTPEVEDLFDDSAANRVDAALEQHQDVLKGAKNGWLMEFYPEAQQSYGGYNLLVSFTDDKATFSGENADPEEKVASYYSLKQSAGPVLTFDSYNEIFHFYSNPDASVSGLGSNGIGMGGDFEFLVMKATADSVILKGKKTGNKIVMTPFPESVNWTEYLTRLAQVKENLSFTNFEYQTNGKSFPVKASNRLLLFTFTNDEGIEETVKAPFILKETGYKLYSPLNILGQTINEFTFKSEGGQDFFTADNGDSKLVVIYPPLNELLVDGDWFFKYSGLGDFGKTYWNYTKTNGLDLIGEQLYYAYMGKYSGDNKTYGFSFGSTDGGSLYIGVLVYNYELSGSDEVTYTFAGIGVGNGVWYYSNARFNYLINPIALSTPRTFTLSSDNDKKPTWIKLTDVDTPNNTIILFKEEVILPYTK
ncbi:MAG: DUF4302 domain-containing protein [Dysgonamonadaceae bacterium]